MSSHEKGLRYIGLLDTARASANWSEVPELVRKVTKHAPEHKTLIKSALLDSEIAKFQGAVERTHPASASATTSDSSASALARIESLEKELRASTPQNEEEATQAHTSLLWARWAAPEAVQGPRHDEIAPLTTSQQSSSLSAWSKISKVKGAFISGTLLARDGRKKDAETAYQSAIPFLDANKAFLSSSPQFSYWSEQLTAALAVASIQDAEKEPGKATHDAAFSSFRRWSELASTGKEPLHVAYGHPGPHRTRISIWKSYHLYVSNLLRHQASAGGVTAPPASRGQQVAVLRQIETSYESELLRTTDFPRADESNYAIEEWVEQVIGNWQILANQQGSGGIPREGELNSLGRNVLEILYRAAGKTYHSSLILRRLFQVHKALADFDLAYRAFDTYLVLIERARARAKKTGHPSRQDKDEIVLATIAEAIEGLTTSGRQSEAEKAYSLCSKLEALLVEVDPTAAQDQAAEKANGYHESPPSSQSLQLQTKERVYRALGIGKAHWAIWTPFNEQRSVLQADAVTHLMAAVNLPLPDSEKLSSFYALSLLLAETGDVDTALDITKQTLAQESHPRDFALQRKRVPIWHLLTLLLTARQEFDTAGRTSVAAFEQFPSPQVLFGTKPKPSASGATEKGSTSGLIDDMECSELQRIIEVRVTELALADLSEGPEDAVNHSNELLALYYHLFGHLDVSGEQKPTSRQPEKPKSVKSSHGSIFGRRKLASNHDPMPGEVPSGVERSTPGTGHTPSTRSAQPSWPQPSASLSTSNSGEETPAAVSTVSVKDQGSQSNPQPLPTIEANPTVPESDPASQHSEISFSSPITRFPRDVSQRHALVILARLWLFVASLYRRAALFDDAKDSTEEAAKAAGQVESLVAAQESSARAFADRSWGAGGASSNELWADVYFERAELQLAIARVKQQKGLASTESNDLLTTRNQSGPEAEIDNVIVRDAVELFESCLAYFPNHPGGIVGLSNVLLDYYEGKVELGRKVDDTSAKDRVVRVQTLRKQKKDPLQSLQAISQAEAAMSANGFADGTVPQRSEENGAAAQADNDLKKMPENLNRLAARDRAYGLLCTLTKLGTGWDNSEAWFALSRAHELAGDLDKAKDVLWWVVRLEDVRPLRHWRVITGGTGYVL